MKYYILFLFVMASFNLCSQVNYGDSIIVVEDPKPSFFQGGERLKPSQVSLLLKQDSKAQGEFAIAQLNYYLGYGLETAGVLMGVFLVKLLIYKESMNWFFFGAGSAAYLLSFPLMEGYKKRSRNAIKIYNENIEHTSFNIYSIQFGLNSLGIGLSLNF